MKPLSKNSFWNKYNKFSIWVLIIAGLLLIVTVLPQLVIAKWALFKPLPTWEVNDPVSKVFVMDEIPQTTGSLAAGDSTVPNEYLVDPAINTLILLMEARGVHLYKTSSNTTGIVGSDDVVIIKGNFQWSGRSSTNTDRIKGLIWRILQHPDGFTGEILVGDNTQWRTIDQDDNNSEDQEQCIIDVINTFYSKGYPVYLFNWTTITHNVVTEYSDGDYNDGYTYDPTSKITYPKFLSPSGNHHISLKYGIWDSTLQEYDLDKLCLVNMPVLKAHGYSGSTVAIKNWIGVLTTHDFNTRFGGGSAMHYDYFFSSFALVAKVMMVTFPKLTIVDAEWTNAVSNQDPNSSEHTKMLLSSTDPCAASWYAAKFILRPISSGPTDPDLPNGKYHNVINNWVNCFQDSGFAVTIDASEISVYDLTNSPVPVELYSFIGKVIIDNIHLKWITKTEINNYGFEIERKQVGDEWLKIGFIEGHGNSNSPKTYVFVDTRFFGGNKFKYRLKQIDTDGKYEYSDEIEVEIILTKFALYQNYPNPFNPTTKIRYQLPKESKVVIKIYDILGSEVITLLNEKKELGVYEVELNAQSLPSGTYIYRIIAEDFVETKKMVLIK